jgi:hypothetical protein
MKMIHTIIHAKSNTMLGLVYFASLILLFNIR